MIKQVIAEEREVGLVVVEEGLREGLEVGPEGLQPLGVELLGLEGYLGHGLQLVEPEPHLQGPAAALVGLGRGLGAQPVPLGRPVEPRLGDAPVELHGPRRSWGPPAGGGLFVVFSGSPGSGGRFPAHRPS